LDLNNCEVAQEKLEVMLLDSLQQNKVTASGFILK
jgi:hypothetical protein